MRAGDEGLSTGAKLEVKTIDAVSDISADVLEQAAFTLNREGILESALF